MLALEAVPSQADPHGGGPFSRRGQPSHSAASYHLALCVVPSGLTTPAPLEAMSCFLPWPGGLHPRNWLNTVYVSLIFKALAGNLASRG